MAKKKVDFMITGFRDGFQSVFGARVFTKDFIPALEAASAAGLKHFEVGGGARFQSPYFYSNEDAFEMMDACRATLRGGTSIMMFPEGTRSRTGELQAFKPGAFSLARETGSPLLPIVLDGSARALPKRGFVLRGRSDIAVHVLPEVPVEQDDPRDATELVDDVRGRIADELAQMRPQGAGSPSGRADSTG